MPAIDDHPLRLRRLASGLTQIELARLAGVTRATIGQIEEGRVRRVNPAVLAVLADRSRQPVAVLVAEYEGWRDGQVLSSLSERGRNTLSLPPSVVAQYASFAQWRADVARNPTAFASLLRIPRSTVVKYEAGLTGMPSSLYYALINRLGLSEEYVKELRKLDGRA